MKKTRKILLVTLFSVLFLGLAGAGGYLLYNSLATSNLAGVEWYSEDETEFTISTADELFEFAKLSEYYDFKGQTVKLDADIVINEGNAEKWAKEAPARKWNPILNFAGTFDGQGHTISGMYGVGYMESMGMFGSSQRGCVIKNFKLVNSYFKNNGDKGTGSILAKGGGTIDTVYSDAIVVSNGWHSGGLVGTFTVSGTNKITNCWFDGTLTMEMEYGRYAGGILGTANALGAMNRIEHCLNSGAVSTAATSNPIIGGICGAVMNNGAIQLVDNLNVGMVTTKRGIYGIGSIIGRSQGSTSQIAFENNYASSESYYTALGGSEGKVTGTNVRLRTVNLIGYEGYQWTELDFEKYWAVDLEGTPVLQSFTDTIVDLDGVAKKIDKSWYVEGVKEFTLTTAAQLFGFAELSRTIDFKDVTIKLGADIVCNEGNASDWAKNEPINVWKPIGYNGEFGGKTFLGTFDGQGHTISGLYAKSKSSMVSFFGETGQGSVVKNLKIKNSYFEAEISKSSSWGMVAGVVAKSWGTIDTVYSNVILVNSGTVTGGIVGMMRITGKNGGECVIRNCWYDGKIKANGSTGGILGDVYASPATVEHCLNTGKIETMSACGNIGGLVGIVELQDSKLTLKDSLNVGKIEDASKKSWNVGSAIGRVVKTDKVTNIVATIDDVYVSKESSGNAIGNKTGNFKGDDIVRVAEKDLLGTNGYFFTGLQFYSGGKGYWVAQANKTPVLKSFAPSKALAVGGIRVDTSWYNKDKDVYTIKNANQLYGLRQLSETTDFKGKTIKLANDIVINSGDASTWGEKAPRYSWRPIGYNSEFGGKTFAGTFDGQGHTVSGLYGKTNSNMMSFFGEIGTTGVIKNVKVMNSYFEAELQKTSSWGMVAGVVAKSWGTVDTVYSNATLVNNGTVTGGIVGMMRITGNQGGACVVRNCWYDGDITANGSTGGIIADIYGCEATIENCLNTGSITTMEASGNIGGLVGIVEQPNGKLNVTDSLNLGEIKDPSNKSWNVGSVLGRAVKTETTETEVYMKDVYASKESSGNAIGNKTGNFLGEDPVRLSLSELTGDISYLKTQLSFYIKDKNETGKWVVFANSTPELKSFAKEGSLDLTNALRVDTDWYAKEPYEIRTASELYGLAELSKTENFAGKTIYLKDTIVLNESMTNPKYAWTPIENFAGTFDGGMNTISGVYLKSGDECLGFFKQVSGTVQNLIIEDSYIENTKTSGTGATGSVVGRLTGTLKTVKSSADVVLNGSEYAGGLVGDITAAGGKIENCWFAGSVSGTGAHHGTILGGTRNSGTTATIKNCLSTGTIDARANTGGLVGAAWTGSVLTIRETLYAGNFVSISGVSPYNIATVIGNAKKNALVATKVYVGNDALIGAIIGNNESSSNSTASIYKLNRDTQLAGSAAYENTDLDFYAKDKNETGVWFAVEDGTPVLTSFTDKSNPIALTVDTYWFDTNDKKESYTLTSVAEFRGFQKLAATENFYDIEIKLGADIDLNPGWTAGATAPEIVWTPIGRDAKDTSVIKAFRGTFDGQGHTIEGVYINTDLERIGLFATTGEGAKIQNFTLENSYIKSTKASGVGAVGSIVGRLGGTLDTVKSSADVVLSGCEYAGGMVGDIHSTVGATMNNCWFAGSVSGTGSHHGQLLGGVRNVGGSDSKATCTISNCLATGNIDLRSNAGGLVGTIWKPNCTLIIKDSLFAGRFVTGLVSSSSQNGTIIGNATNGTATVTNTYAKEGTGVSTKIGNKGSNSDAGVTNLSTSKLYGSNAFGYMNVDFYEKDKNETGVWFAVEGSNPILTSFANKSQAIDLSTAQGTRTYWYDAENPKKSYTLNSPAELRGLQVLAADYNFYGIEIKLGKDIDLNPGWVAGATAPANVWTPIGRDADDTSVIKPFRGTFNGQGHTIKGVYINSDLERIGFFATTGEDAKIQKFTLENSYIKSTKTGSAGSVGSIVGRLGGTLDTVKSSADVVLSGCEYAGGLVGDINSTVGATINNCWFAGSVSGTGSHHGTLLGGVRKVGTSDTKATCKIINCLSTGEIDYRANTGGLVGAAWTGSTLTIEKTLYAGNYVSVGASAWNIGTVLGNAKKNTTTATDVYVGTDSLVSNVIGSNESSSNSTASIFKLNRTTQLAGEAARTNLKNFSFYEKVTNEKGIWYVVEGSNPVLASFVEKQ